MNRLQPHDPPKIFFPFGDEREGRCRGRRGGCGPQVSLLISVVAAGFHIDPKAVLATTRRSADIALSRQAAMYLAHVSLGLSLTEVGLRFDRDRTTVAHACRLIEDLRDGLEFDFAMDHLEGAANKLVQFCEQS